MMKDIIISLQAEKSLSEKDSKGAESNQLFKKKWVIETLHQYQFRLPRMSDSSISLSVKTEVSLE